MPNREIPTHPCSRGKWDPQRERWESGHQHLMAAFITNHNQGLLAASHLSVELVVRKGHFQVRCQISNSFQFLLWWVWHLPPHTQICSLALCSTEASVASPTDRWAFPILLVSATWSGNWICSCLTILGSLKHNGTGVFTTGHQTRMTPHYRFYNKQWTLCLYVTPSSPHPVTHTGFLSTSTFK